MHGAHSKPKAGETLSDLGKIEQNIARSVYFIEVA
jgi:hypothetical protein